jgi:hypothetical protein
MLMTQKYHSANEIDPEFIPELEGLLSHCVPSFELIKTFEKDAPEHTTFHYYLFFSDKHNGPVGFTQVAIENKFQKQKSMRIFRKLKAHQSFLKSLIKEMIYYCRLLSLDKSTKM